MSSSPKRNQPPQQQHREVRVTQHYQGVIPPPEMMEHFSRIDPSFPGRILAMAENEGDARRQKEKSIIKKSFTLDILGMVTGVIVVGGVIWLCYEFVQKGYPTEAATVACGVLVALAVVFVIRKQPKQTTK